MRLLVVYRCYDQEVVVVALVAAFDYKCYYASLRVLSIPIHLNDTAHSLRRLLPSLQAECSNKRISIVADASCVSGGFLYLCHM